VHKTPGSSSNTEEDCDSTKAMPNLHLSRTTRLFSKPTTFVFSIVIVILQFFIVAGVGTSGHNGLASGVFFALLTRG
jgi:hypothetical protein